MLRLETNVLRPYGPTGWDPKRPYEPDVMWPGRDVRRRANRSARFSRLSLGTHGRPVRHTEMLDMSGVLFKAVAILKY